MMFPAIKQIWALFVLVMLWLVLAWLSGCSSAPAPVPSGCEHSLIYQTAARLHTTPKAVGTIFQLADMRLIRSNSVAKSDVARFLNDVQDLLESGTTTYLDLVSMVTLRVEKLQANYGPEVMLLISAFSEQLSQPILLDPCDRTMLLRHVADQREVLEML